MIRTVLCFGLVLLFACAKKTSTDLSGDCQWNKSMTVALCIQDSINDKSGISTTRYHIYDKHNELLKEGTLNGGYVRWLDENAIEIYQPPGMIKEGTNQNDLVKVFMTKNQQVVSKSSYLSMDQK